MISAAVVAAALSFWAPYTQADPVCPNGVHVQAAPVPANAQPATAGSEVLAWTGLGARDCRVWVSKWFKDRTQGRQCTTLVHELGHNWVGLPHDDSHPNVMNSVDPPEPGVCANFDRRPQIGTALSVTRVRLCRAHGVRRVCWYRTTEFEEA